MTKRNLEFDFELENEGAFCNSYYGREKIKRNERHKSESERCKGRKLNKRRKVAKSA